MGPILTPDGQTVPLWHLVADVSVGCLSGAYRPAVDLIHDARAGFAFWPSKVLLIIGIGMGAAWFCSSRAQHLVGDSMVVGIR